MTINSFSNLEEVSAFRRKYHAAKLIMDTNVLMVLFVGVYDKIYFPTCPLMTENGKNYKIEDFEILKKIIAIFLDRVVITPHVLAEINSLAKKHIKQPHRDPHFQKLIEQLNNVMEHPVTLKKLLASVGLTEFGFTDMSIVELAKENFSERWAILTDEKNLVRAYEKEVPVISFSRVLAGEAIK